MVKVSIKNTVSMKKIKEKMERYVRNDSVFVGYSDGKAHVKKEKEKAK
jgi:hypothetical protein